MKTGTWKTSICSFLLAGLFVLAGLLSNAHTALAQLECPLPAGVSPPAPTPVTAQQVEDGSATLKDFVLASRERSDQQATSPEEAAYIGCLIRQDGSDWRSGSTYIVSLTPDGRVFVHAKDMSLSGGQLDFRIYGAILVALGINPADLAHPATAGAAFANAIAGDGGPFDASSIVPGASGYAVAYFSANFQSPIVLLAGFDLDRSHLVAEPIEHLQPEVTARDVVDRATLKAFVDAAGAYFIQLQESGDLAAANKARLAFRDPNGPWRHGSVYLAVMDPASRIILFHGGFPDRFELQRGGIATDIATGELVVEQLIRAANSSPEGGFWEYYFDNPADANDSAEVPKTGYARLFTGNLPGRGPVPFIINSGFYPGATPAVAAVENRVVETVLPQVMRAMTASTVDAISARVQQAASGASPAAKASLGGASTLTDLLEANGRALQNGTLDPGRLLGRSSFTLPLGAAGDGGIGPFGGLTVWASGDYRSLSGGTRRTVTYDGNVVSANLGVDSRLGANLLAGLSVARAQGMVDYIESGAQEGEFTTEVTSINPYLGWQAPGGLNVWATAGHGWGEVEIEDSTGAETGDLTQQMVAAGVSGPVMSSDSIIPGGTTKLTLKGEVAFTQAEIEGSGTLDGVTLTANRQRLVLEAAHVGKLASGATFSPLIEIGVRNDGGDGETGHGIEAGGGLRFADPAAGLTVEGRARTLITPDSEYEEWGVSGLVRVGSGASDRGLALVVQPAWGLTSGGVERLWETGVAGTATPAGRAAGRVNAEIGYGLGAAPGLGVVTPYAGLGLAGEGARSWRMGARWQVAPAARLSLEGTLREPPNHRRLEHGLMLRGALRR